MLSDKFSDKFIKHLKRKAVEKITIEFLIVHAVELDTMLNFPFI